MSWRHLEPRLEDMLADSIVKAVMERLTASIRANSKQYSTRSRRIYGPSRREANPVEQSTKVELAVKLQTAKALG